MIDKFTLDDSEVPGECSYEVAIEETRLEIEHILVVELAHDGSTVELVEDCDRYYRARADKAQLTRIIDGLVALRDRMTNAR